MEQHDFFKNLQNHFDDALPFVVYSKPNTQLVVSFLQEDATLHQTIDYSESGFVFSPFDNRSLESILIPQGDSVKQTFNYTENQLAGSTDFNASNFNIESTQRENHIQLVNKAISEINRGDLKKVVLSRKQKINTSRETPISIFQRLLSLYPTAFTYCWYHPKVGLWLGATPEVLLSLKNNRLHTMALAGTQKAIDNKEVKWGRKEQEEQEFVTDAILENLSGLVSTIKHSDTYTYKAGSLLHLRTDINATIDSDAASLQSIIKTLHPTPAVCGLPRDKARNFIHSNEGYSRSYYTGFLGELNIKSEIRRANTNRNVENLAFTAVKKSTDLFVNLRCLEIDAQGVNLYVGGGITGSSKPEDEWQETVNKLQTMRSVL